MHIFLLSWEVDIGNIKVWRPTWEKLKDPISINKLSVLRSVIPLILKAIGKRITVQGPRKMAGGLAWVLEHLHRRLWPWVQTLVLSNNNSSNNNKYFVQKSALLTYLQIVNWFLTVYTHVIDIYESFFLGAVKLFWQMWLL
jgi:hypothetical protein